MTTEAPAPALSLQELRNATELLERECVASGRLDDTALDARRPGASATYATTAPGDWLAYALFLAGEAGAARAGRPVAARGRTRDQILHEALADTPKPVLLRSGQRILIHPKSLDTLLFLEAIDADLRTVATELREALAATEGPSGPLAQADFLRTLLTRLSVRLFVWILAHEGPGLPFREDAAEPAPPEWTAQIHGEDLEAILLAHLEVNREDLAFLAQSFPGEIGPVGPRLPLSGFLGAMAQEWGLPAREVMRQWSLRGLYAQAIMAAESQRLARAAAESHRTRELM